MNGLTYLERMKLIDEADEFWCIFHQLLMIHITSDNKELWQRAEQILPKLIKDVKS